MRSEFASSHSAHNNNHNNRSNLSSTNNGNFNNNANSASGRKSAQQRKSAVTDVTHVIGDECQRLLSESHTLISKYQSFLLVIGSQTNDTLQFRDELRKLRCDMFYMFKTGLEKLVPQFDQVSTKDNQISPYVQQIATLLEYLKLLFTRNLYLLNSFKVKNMQQSILQSATSHLVLKTSNMLIDKANYENIYEQNYNNELNDLEKDITDVTYRLDMLTQKYFTFIPDIEEIHLTNGMAEKSASIQAATRLYTKCRFLCCLCTPQYL